MSKVPDGVDIVDILFDSAPAVVVCRHGRLWSEGSIVVCPTCLSRYESDDRPLRFLVNLRTGE